MSISTITSTLVFLYLADKQRNANYPHRIIYGEVITAVVFLFLALSCFILMPNDSIYFFYLLFSMFVATVGTSYSQNGSFAVVSLYEPVYTQAVMVGQAIAGIVPPLASMLSALSYKSSDGENETSTGGDSDGSSTPKGPDTTSSIAQWSSFGYFIAATSLALAAIFLYITSINKSRVVHEPDESEYLRYEDYDAVPVDSEEEETTAFFPKPRDDKSRRGSAIVAESSIISPLEGSSSISQENSSQRQTQPLAMVEDQEAMAKGDHHTSIPLSLLFKKLCVPATTVFLVFSVTLAYPVFASRVLSSTLGLTPQLFIPLVFFVWNFGDLMGRIICGLPGMIVTTDKSMLSYGFGRLIFIPIFILLCMSPKRNDFVYLFIHFLFGLTNGHLCSSAFIQFPKYVDETEREAGGGFMTLTLSLGLTAGSLFSFVLSALVNSVSV